jgi:two-component system alkaline phosphatase synthesis response regulator PhoP
MSRIVLIEDDDGIAELLCFNLELAGHLVLTAHDGVSGLRLARTSAPDVVVLDLDLKAHGMDGIEVGRRLRRSPRTPLIMMTTREGSEVNAVPGLRLGAGDFIAKPFSVRELLERIASVQQPAELSASNLG